jgi:hypothetical protein
VRVPVVVLREYCETVVVYLFAAYTLFPSGLTTTRAVPGPADTLAGDNAVSVPAVLDASATDPPLNPSTSAGIRARFRQPNALTQSLRSTNEPIRGRQRCIWRSAYSLDSTFVQQEPFEPDESAALHLAIIA